MVVPFTMGVGGNETVTVEESNIAISLPLEDVLFQSIEFLIFEPED